jgi:hypothetical protein
MIQQHIERDEPDFNIEFFEKAWVARARLDDMLVRRVAKGTCDAVETFAQRVVLSNVDLFAVRLRQMPMHFAALAMKIAVRTLHKQSQIQTPNDSV